jgi:hypothetical protein
MNADELADHLVDHFNSIEEPLIAFQAQKPDEIPEAEKERSDFNVFVVPFGETETKINRADSCDERRQVSVVIHGPIASVTRSLAIKFVEQLKRSLRRTIFEGFRWASNESVQFFNPEALKLHGQFYSVFRTEYLGIS